MTFSELFQEMDPSNYSFKCALFETIGTHCGINPTQLYDSEIGKILTLGNPTEQTQTLLFVRSTIQQLYAHYLLENNAEPLLETATSVFNSFVEVINTRVLENPIEIPPFKTFTQEMIDEGYLEAATNETGEEFLRSVKNETRIKIIRVPAGEAPEEIRADWLGVEMISDHRGDGYGIKSRTFSGNGYAVVLKEAISALRKAGKDEAADWWTSFYKSEDYPISLVFSPEDIAIL